MSVALEEEPQPAHCKRIITIITQTQAQTASNLKMEHCTPAEHHLAYIGVQTKPTQLKSMDEEDNSNAQCFHRHRRAGGGQRLSPRGRVLYRHWL